MNSWKHNRCVKQSHIEHSRQNRNENVSPTNWQGQSKFYEVFAFLWSNPIREFRRSRPKVTRLSIVREIGKVNPVRTSAIRSGLRTCARWGSIVSPIAAAAATATTTRYSLRETSARRARNYSSLSFQEPPRTYPELRLIEEMTLYRPRAVSSLSVRRTCCLPALATCGDSRLTAESVAVSVRTRKKSHLITDAMVFDRETGKRLRWRAAKRQAWEINERLMNMVERDSRNANECIKRKCNQLTEPRGLLRANCGIYWPTC